MSTQITLPCTILGLARVGSVVTWGDSLAVISRVDDGIRGHFWVAGVEEYEGGYATDVNLHLDLSDPTSRVHAAWWVCGQGGGISEEEHTVLLMARNGVNINAQGQEQLRDMVLRRVRASPSPDKQPGADGIPLDQEKP